MSTPPPHDANAASVAAEQAEKALLVPAPPGGHALRINRTSHGFQAATSPFVIDEISAGGLVTRMMRGHIQAAIIARRNRGGRLEWCLPKGHLEGTETPEEAAIREISEETGITGVVHQYLGTIDYWFGGDTKRIHKVVHHFLLVAVGGYLTVDNDPDAEAELADWVQLDVLPERLSYPNERRLAIIAQEITTTKPLFTPRQLGHRPALSPRVIPPPRS